MMSLRVMAAKAKVTLEGCSKCLAMDSKPGQNESFKLISVKYILREKDVTTNPTRDKKKGFCCYCNVKV